MSKEKQTLNKQENGNDSITDDSNYDDDYGTEEYCTCDKHFYEEHVCPFKNEILDDEELCDCCPHCLYRCYLEI